MFFAFNQGFNEYWGSHNVVKEEYKETFVKTGQFVKVESGTTKEECEKVEIHVPVPVHIVLLDKGVITKHSLIQYI